MDTETTNNTNLIPRNIPIAEMVEKYPMVIDFLVFEYGFHCVSCFVSSFEVLEDGARVHGIAGEEFEELLTQVNKLASGELVYES